MDDLRENMTKRRHAGKLFGMGKRHVPMPSGQGGSCPGLLLTTFRICFEIEGALLAITIEACPLLTRPIWHQQEN